MIIPKIIFYLTSVAWLFPPFRQRGCRYFLFFLVLALSDPVWYLITLFHFGDSSFHYLVISTLALTTALRKKQVLMLLIPVLFAGIFLNPPEIRIFTIIVHFFILIFFLREFILIISKESAIVVFNLILLLYETTVLFKFSATYFMTAGYLYFYLTTAFEILIAIFFSFVNEKNSPVIKLRMEPDTGD